MGEKSVATMTGSRQRACHRVGPQDPAGR